MSTTIKFDLASANQIIKNRGLATGGVIQKKFTNEIASSSERFIPHLQGVLAGSAFIPTSGEYLEYNTPYARYLWHGKLMVDPITGKGAFFSQEHGFWSRKGVQKVLTETDLNFSGGPIRGPKWTLRAWDVDGSQILRGIERELNK